MSQAGRFLLEEELVSAAQLEKAALLQSTNGGTIGLHLVRAGVLRESDLVQLFCAKLDLDETCSDELAEIPLETTQIISRVMAVEHRVIPCHRDASWLTLAMADPSDDRAVADVARASGLRLIIKVAPESEMSMALKSYYGASEPRQLDDLVDEDGFFRSFESSFPSDGRLDVRESQIPDKGSRRRTGRFRAPAVLEGNYERISPEELPSDASAGYIPLTSVKKRPTPTPSAGSVIRVQTVQIGSPLPDVKKSKRIEPAVDPDAIPPRRKPPFEDAERSDTWTGLPQVTSCEEVISAHDITPDPSEPESVEFLLDESLAIIELEEDAVVPPSTGTLEVVPTLDDEFSSHDDLLVEDLEEIPTEPKSDVITRKNPVKAQSSYVPPPPGTPLEPRDDARTVLSTAPAKIDDLVEDLSVVASRDEAIQKSLSYLSQSCRRVAFFIVRRGVVEGFSSLGPSLSNEQVRSIWIPLSSPSTINEVVESQRIRVGPVGSTRTDAIFCASLGGRRGDSIVLPIVVGKRVVSLVYGDDLRQSSPSSEPLQKLQEAVSKALRRLMVQEKRKSITP